MCLDDVQFPQLYLPLWERRTQPVLSDSWTAAEQLPNGLTVLRMKGFPSHISFKFLP